MRSTTIDHDTLSTIIGGGAISRCIDGAYFARKFVEPSYRMGLMSPTTVLKEMGIGCAFAVQNPSSPWTKAFREFRANGGTR